MMRQSIRMRIAVVAAALACALFVEKAGHADLRVPAWYDENAIGTAPDWHYRVPINIPAGTPVNSTIKVDVDFAALLTQLGVSGAFDVNSPRVVRPTGALATNQEFTDTVYAGATDAIGNARGEVRFILQDAGPSTYYVYFDITANGAKAGNPQVPINGNFEFGAVGTEDPSGWTASKTNANFDAQIRNAETPSINTDGTGIPDTVTTDGTPLTGAQSYLMGARTNNEAASANPAITLTKTFVKPSTCTSGFSLRYRPEGWDSSWAAANQTQYDFIRITLSSGATSVVMVGPNGPSYATFPYSPNFGSNGNNAASNTQSGYGPYNGFDTNNNLAHMLGMTVARGSQPWFNPTNNLSSFAAGATVTLTITSTHTVQYKSWVHIDDVEWCVVNGTLGAAEAFGVNITAPASSTTYAVGDLLSITAQADAQATGAGTSIFARLYNPSGTQVGGDIALGGGAGGVYTNATAYTFLATDTPGTWTLRVFARDASTSTIGATNGVIHIPGQPNSPESQANFYNIDEQTFTFLGAVFNSWDLPLPAGTTPVAGNITTKVAGIAFQLGVVRVNAAGTAIDTTYNQSGVTVELLDASDNTGALQAATGCRASWATVIATMTVNFTNGKATTPNITVNNAYKDVRARISKSGTGSGTACSNDNFAIRPQSFGISATDATWTTAGTTRTLNATAYNGNPVHKAGQPFTIRVTSVVPAAATNYLSTGNHTGTPTVRTATCTLPTGGTPACSTCTDGTLTPGAFTAGGGVLTSTTASYTEAGTLNLDLHDTNFAAVDAADGTPDTYSNTSPAGTYNQYGRRVPQTATVAVGRFVPDNFVTALTTAPVFQTFNANDAACHASAPAPKRSFTYVGQPFGYATLPVFTVTARNAAGGTTTNYRQCVWKITASATPPSDIVQTYATSTPGKTLDTSLAGTPTVTPGNGTGAVSPAATGRIAFQRVLNPSPPDTPFQATIALTMNASDDAETDGVIAGTAATASNIAFDGGDFQGPTLTAGRTFVYGQARMLNALGSEKLNLPIPLRVEYWNGTTFITNTKDHCTGFVSGNFVLSNYQGGITAANVPAGNISTAGPMNAGVGGLTLVKPSPAPASPGSVDICFDLDPGASGDTACQATAPADKNWLQGKWSSANYDKDPKARAAFGLYGAQPPNFIYFRENY